MSLPTEADFAIIKIGDGATPTEVFAIACGIQDVTINQAVGTQDRFSRDCTKPGEIPNRKVKATGKSLDVTGSGLIDKAQIAIYNSALGVAKNYKIEVYADNGTDAGALLGTIAGSFMMTASNMSIPREGTASAEVTLANNGAWTWTAA